MRVRKGDTVLVISGKDRGKKAKVRDVLHGEGKVVVDGLNMIKQHTRARGQAKQAGIIDREAPLDVAKVMLLCGKCDHPTRIQARFLEDDKKVRSCHRCGEVID